MPGLKRLERFELSVWLVNQLAGEAEGELATAGNERVKEICLNEIHIADGPGMADALLQELTSGLCSQQPIIFFVSRDSVVYSDRLSKFFTTDEAARQLGVTPSRIRQFILQTRLKFKRIGRDHLIDESEVHRFAQLGTILEAILTTAMMASRW